VDREKDRPARGLNLKLSHGSLLPQEKILYVYMCHSVWLRNVFINVTISLKKKKKSVS